MSARHEFRRAHGKARELGRLTASECPPLDELRPGSALAPVRADRDAAGRFVAGNRAGTVHRVKAGKRGALIELERKGDPAARAAIAFGRRYASHRRAELARCHGGELSAGVAAMVESAGELLAASRYWQARSVAEGSPDFARLAAQLAAGARQSERDAWQLADLEARSRPASPADFAWLQPQPGWSPDGESASERGSAPDGEEAPAGQSGGAP
jgi:hypothetical protein